MDKNLRDQHLMVCPMFTTVGDADSITLADLGVAGYGPFDEGEWLGGCSGDVYIKILTKDGSTATDPETGANLVYYWYDDGDTMYAEGKGWYTGNGVAAGMLEGSKIPFDAGAGLWIYCGVANAYITTSGQVALGDMHVKMRDQHNATGNPYPVTRTLADCAVTGYNAFDEGEWSGGCSGDFYIKILAKDGSTATDPETGANIVYYWYDDGDTMYADGKGWYTGNGVAAGKIDPATVPPFAAGDGLWIYHGIPDAPNVYFDMKAPVLSK